MCFFLLLNQQTVKPHLRQKDTHSVQLMRPPLGKRLILHVLLVTRATRDLLRVQPLEVGHRHRDVSDVVSAVR